MAQIICFANNKGGVGKSTTTAAIGHAWARQGKRILFIDLDSQANLTSIISPLMPDQHEVTIRDAFLDKHNFKVEHVDDMIDIVPSELSLSNFDRDTASVTGREYLLLDLLKPVKKDYDFILIDCPPALGLITYNALIAADHLVMVSNTDGLSYSGMVMIANLFNDVRSSERLNPALKLTGVIITRYEKNRLSEMYLAKIKDELGDAVISPVIHKATKIAQAASFGQNIFEYDPEGKATKEYLQVADVLYSRVAGE